MRTVINIIAVLGILSAVYGVLQNFIGNVEAKSAVHQIYYSVEAIKYALVPYCIVKLASLLK